jgi:cardiolipin synthase
MVSAGLRVALLGALALLSACATAPGAGPATGDRPETAGQSPELAALGPGTRPSGDRPASEGSVVSDGVAVLKALVVKPVFRPVSSLNRLLFLALDTSVDAVKPVSLLLEPDGPVPPVAQGPGMDLAQWERRLDRLTSSRASSGSIRFLIDGEQFFPRFVETVMDARRSVHLRSYIFDTDDYATAVADLLKRRSAQVEVKVLLDGLGSLVAAGMVPDSMPRSFSPPGSIEAYLERDSEVAVRVQATPWLAGDHVKTFIVDRRTAFVGGMNIGREYRHDWHDLMMEVRGPVVAELDREFDKAWARAGPFGDLAVLAQALRPRKTAEGGDGHPLRVLHTKPGNAQIYRAQLAAIRAARRYIYIHNPYFSDDEILVELVRARRRGVDVRVVLSTRGDNAVMDRSNMLAANAMFRRGIRVYLYPGFSHVKAAIYDGWACLGSANLDKLSLRVNRELNLATSHPETVRALEQGLFEADFETSMEMTKPFEENWTYYMAELLSDQL